RRIGLESRNREIHVMPLSAKGVGEPSGFDQLEKLSVLCTQGLHLFSTGREGSETCMAFSKTQAAPAPKRCDSDCSPGALTPTGSTPAERAARMSSGVSPNIHALSTPRRSSASF